MKGVSIEERAVNLAHYIIDSKDTVRGAAKKFGVSKSTVHTDVTLKNGLKSPNIILNLHDKDPSKCVAEHCVLHIPEYIEIKKVFLAEKNPVVKLGLVIK